MSKLKGYCGYCGTAIYDKDIFDGRIVCSKCHWDYWESELLPIDYEKQGYKILGA